MPHSEEVPLFHAAGRVIAEEVAADRDQPPLPRSARDGFAVRAEDMPGEFAVIGEVRAGAIFSGQTAPGQAVEIMTGAPVPSGANAVVMVEHCRVNGNRFATDRVLQRGDNIMQRASEAVAGEVVLKPGKRLGFAEIALLAAFG